MPFSPSAGHTRFAMARYRKNLLSNLAFTTPLLVIVLSGLIEGPTAAQPLRERDPQFRVDSTLVLIPVTVTDARGASVGGLGKDSFTVLDDRKPQPITAFFSEDAPASIGIVLDVSGSMRDKLEMARSAVRSFLQLSNPEDDFFLVTVSSSPANPIGSTDEAGDVANIVRVQGAGGDTALIDSVYLALNHARSSPKARRALFVISDGMDNHSRYSESELLRLVMESDVQIYTIAAESPRVNMKGSALAEVQTGLGFMEDLAAKGGGFCIRLWPFDNPSQAATRISGAIRNQYVIGYRSPDPDKSGKWHQIRVKVNLNKANVYARSGYQLQ